MISLDGYNCLAVIMSFSTEEDAINAMLLEFGGEDVDPNRDAILSHTVDVVTVATYLYVRIVMYRLYNHTIILLRSRSNVNNDIFSYNSNAH